MNEGDREVSRSSVPLARTFESPRFRLLVAGVLLVFGLLINLGQLSAMDMSDPGIGLDFAAYYHAAERVADGLSPYGQLGSVGDSAYCRDCYLYPPPLAQVMQPLAAVPIETAKLVWFGLGYMAAFASTWIATGIGGARRSIERALWCLVATLFFFPALSAIWNGNIGNLVSLCVTLVALGGAAAGVGSALGAFLKVAPVTLMPAAFVASRESRLSLLATVVVVGGVAFVLAPGAWLDYPAVLTDVMSLPSQAEQNLALTFVASSAGWDDTMVALVRALLLTAGVACVGGSIWAARRPDGMPLAALLGTVAFLVIPGTMWFHYLAVALPFAAMAWPRARSARRVILLAGCAVISVGPMTDERVAVWVGAPIVLIAAAVTLWPAPTPTRDPLVPSS